MTPQPADSKEDVSGQSPDASPPLTPSEPSPNDLMRWVMLAVGAWGGMLALGAFLYGLDAETGRRVYSPNPQRGLVVLAVVAMFLGVWSTAWAFRKRRLRQGQ
jgi:hypothetical protein